MLNTAQGLKVSKAGVTGNTYIIDNDYSDGDIVSPKRFVMHLAGLLIGAVLGALLVLTRAMLRTTIDDPADIESRLGLPVYATIPFSKAAEGRRGQRGPDSLMVRAAPTTRRRELAKPADELEFALMGAGSKMLAITGPTPACGSFVSGNLAVLAAQTGARVVDRRRSASGWSVSSVWRPAVAWVVRGAGGRSVGGCGDSGEWSR